MHAISLGSVTFVVPASGIEPALPIGKHLDLVATQAFYLCEQAERLASLIPRYLGFHYLSTFRLAKQVVASSRGSNADIRENVDW